MISPVALRDRRQHRAPALRPQGRLCPPRSRGVAVVLHAVRRAPARRPLRRARAPTAAASRSTRRSTSKMQKKARPGACPHALKKKGPAAALAAHRPAGPARSRRSWAGPDFSKQEFASRRRGSASPPSSSQPSCSPPRSRRASSPRPDVQLDPPDHQPGRAQPALGRCATTPEVQRLDPHLDGDDALGQHGLRAAHACASARALDLAGRARPWA